MTSVDLPIVTRWICQKGRFTQTWNKIEINKVNNLQSDSIYSDSDQNWQRWTQRQPMPSICDWPKQQEKNLHIVKHKRWKRECWKNWWQSLMIIWMYCWRGKRCLYLMWNGKNGLSEFIMRPGMMSASKIAPTDMAWQKLLVAGCKSSNSTDTCKTELCELNEFKCNK